MKRVLRSPVIESAEEKSIGVPDVTEKSNSSDDSKDDEQIKAQTSSNHRYEERE